MNSSDTTSIQAATAGDSFLSSDEEVSLQEVSHVFYCMQCDLQFQMDMAITSRNGSRERDALAVRIRLDPRINLKREA